VLVLALSLVALGPDAASQSDCMVADQSEGSFDNNGKLAAVLEHKGATELCVTKHPAGISFSFVVSRRRWPGEEARRTDYQSPPPKDYSGTAHDNRRSATGPDGQKYVMRRRPNEISGCVYSESSFVCATVTGKPRKPKPKLDAGPEEVGKTY